MKKENLITDNLTDEKIAEMFSDYVTSKENGERHTDSACDEAEHFELYCQDMFPGEVRMQNEVYDKMMDVAVEFEKSGFIAGVRWVFQLAQEEKTSLTSQITTP